ncbi:MAG: hypothetical protein LBL21_01975, partial [Rickettsiales bacterium]|nr:hypothetical protein [Rickettsiales bacterium]
MGYKREIDLMDPKWDEYEKKARDERRRCEEEAAKKLVRRYISDEEIVNSVVADMKGTMGRA